MIYTTVPFDYLRVRVQDKSTLAWTEIMDKGNEIQIDRGGSVGVLGLDSVNAGTLSMTILNALDPVVVNTLQPKMKIQVYSTLFATPDLGSIYVGNIVDVSSQYFLNNRKFDLDTFVTITAVDAVQSHSNIQIPGVVTAAGFHRWEERIGVLASSAITTVNVPAINTNTVVDSF